MSFEKLMEDLQGMQAAQETLSKALPADDGKDEEKVQAAAAEGGSDNNDDVDAEGGASKPKDGDEVVAKSFEVTLADGTKVQAQDGEALIKSLTDRIDRHETGTVTALTVAMDLIKGQSAMIKSLGEQVAKLGSQGAGRKAVLTITQKPEPLAKSQPAAEGVSVDAFFAKAQKAQAEGRLSGLDISTAEACLNRGEQIPAHIVAKALA